MDEAAALKVYETMARIMAQREGAVVVGVTIKKSIKKPPLEDTCNSHLKEV